MTKGRRERAVQRDPAKWGPMNWRLAHGWKSGPYALYAQKFGVDAARKLHEVDMWLLRTRPD